MATRVWEREGGIDRVLPTRRPAVSAVGSQRWRTLLFVHWEVDPAVLRPLVPPRLAIDTWEGKAYVGLVPFTMEGVRPWPWVPEVDWLTRFHEVNVRTYVHLHGEAPGVWFFSLDAVQTLAVATARIFFHLPYFRAAIDIEHDGVKVEYRHRRLAPTPGPASLRVSYDIGDAAPPSVVGSLQHFLVERYLFYTFRDDGVLVRGRVHHAPYAVKSACLETIDDSLVAAAGVPVLGPPISVLYSPGVDVDVFALEYL
jgi:uncharacterized protein YqjF (DUF2071 family)